MDVLYKIFVAVYLPYSVSVAIRKSFAPYHLGRVYLHGNWVEVFWRCPSREECELLLEAMLVAASDVSLVKVVKSSERPEELEDLASA